MELRIYESIDDVAEKDWDSIVSRDRLICRHSYLKAVEKSSINDCRYYYPVVYKDGNIVAHACVYLISTELDTFATGMLKKLISGIRGSWSGFMTFRSLECGTPIALGNTISVKGTERLQDILPILKIGIEDLARNLGIRIVVFRDFYESELCEFDLLNEFGYKRIRNLPNTGIDIRWGSFTEYLNSMRSHYKWKILKRMKKFYSNGGSIRVVDSFTGYADRLESLWVNVYERAKEYRRERLKADFFRNIDRNLGDRSRIIIAEKDGVVVGFTLLLSDDTTLIPLFSGIDYTYNEEYCIYFNLLYKIIEVAIRERFRRIDLGITTLVPKKDLGACVLPLNIYIKHFNPLLGDLVAKGFNLMTPQDDGLQRRVFKKDGEDSEEYTDDFYKEFISTQNMRGGTA